MRLIVKIFRNEVTHTHTCERVYTRTHTHTCMSAHTRILTYTHKHNYIHISLQTSQSAFICCIFIYCMDLWIVINIKLFCLRLDYFRDTVRVSVREVIRTHAHTHIHTRIYIYIYIYIRTRARVREELCYLLPEYILNVWHKIKVNNST